MDEIIAKGKWEFNQEVADVFLNMLERSIPDYKTMRYLTRRLVERYAQPGTDILDLGCSNGGATAEVLPILPKNTFHLYDVSNPMVEKAKERFRGDEAVKVYNWDITKGFFPANASVVMCVLTLQFTPIEHRLKILQDIYDILVPGGVAIIVEKILGKYYETDNAFVKEYYAMKSANGYTEEQITSKRKSLEGVLVPVTSECIKTFLYDTGFKMVDEYWRCLNFAGYIAIKR